MAVTTSAEPIDWTLVANLAKAISEANLACYADGEWTPGMGEAAAKRVERDIDRALVAIRRGDLPAMRAWLAKLSGVGS
ncbi:MAG: hypothetical protein LCH93_13610 [Proteobacteria bacterium]|nr:hypothetical protein [Pseudomonadota bacterium]